MVYLGRLVVWGQGQDRKIKNSQVIISDHINDIALEMGWGSDKLRQIGTEN